jgi:hypothetical protein
MAGSSLQLPSNLRPLVLSSKKIMTPESELLCLCAVHPVPDARRERLRTLAASGLDWGAFLGLAIEHRVLSLAFRALSLGAQGGVPNAVLERMRVLYFQNLARNMAVQKELLRVLEALKDNGCDVISYKGPLLAETAYGDIGLRQFTDLDLIIHGPDLERAAFVLASLGYDSPLPENARRLQRYRRVLRDFVFPRPEGPCLVELQWRLTQRYHPLFSEMDDVWRRLRVETLAGVPVRTLSGPDMLIVLCLHGLYHAWSYLQMVSDVAQAAARLSGPDWAEALGRAREQGGLRIFLLGLLLARKLLEADLPDGVLEAAERDAFTSGLALRIGASFFERSSYLIRARSFFFLEARMLTGAGRRARYLWGRSFTPNEEDHQALDLPPLLYPFHPILRAVRLLKKYF